jgi:hypothetical protein
MASGPVYLGHGSDFHHKKNCHRDLMLQLKVAHEMSSTYSFLFPYVRVRVPFLHREPLNSLASHPSVHEAGL